MPPHSSFSASFQVVAFSQDAHSLLTPSSAAINAWRTGGAGVRAELSDVKQVVGGYQGYCAVLTSRRVDCWGLGTQGALGDGSDRDSDVPVKVVSTSGKGTLGGVASLVSDNGEEAYCALLTSGRVDCWGYGRGGGLGHGSDRNSDVPVTVVSTSGRGTLSGVASLTSDGADSEVGNDGGFCALLTSRRVDCWGDNGALGNPDVGASAIPVRVVSTSGKGTLSGVESLASDGDDGYCAVLTSHRVDCWGYEPSGVIDDPYAYSAIPATELSPSSGILSGVASLTSDDDGYCALLLSGGVDCWGDGLEGELGDGSYSGAAHSVEVVSTSGRGTALSGVASLAGSPQGAYCALLTSGSVDCWGDGDFGDLGDGSPNSSDIPVEVVSTSGSGRLSGVARLTADGDGNWCAELTSRKVVCWGGDGIGGELGDDSYDASDVPVKVVATSGSGTLSGVANLTSGPDTYSFCALLTSRTVDCWGYAELGDGSMFATSDVPVSVEAARS